MRNEKSQVIVGMCVVSLTKHLMKQQKIDFESAYKHLLTTEIYQLLKDPETNLLIETDEYLKTALDKEVEYGKDALYEFIQDM